MTTDYKHIKFEKEQLKNPRRSGNPPRFKKVDDLIGHGQRLSKSLALATKEVKNQLSSVKDTYIFKISYEDTLNFENLGTHGVEFISQEENQVCVVFSTEKGLATFTDHLQRLGIDDSNITRKQLLEALTSIEAWNSEDRKSWAIKNHGLPEDDEFLLDVELWPIETSISQSRLKILNNFEAWLSKKSIQRIDKVNLDSLVIYRLKVKRNNAELLLNHIDVRLVDLPPSTGIDYHTINRDIASLPNKIASPPSNAPRICILDSGVNTNHPLLKTSLAESASFVEGEEAFDIAGHGTQVAGIVLYGDIEECNSANFWQPEFWIYNGKILNEKCEFDVNTIESVLINSVNYFVELGCKIFNLSIGNENAPYDGKHIRGIAYVLDVLAREHDILFIVSAGNFRGNDDVPVDSWRDEYPDYLIGGHNNIIDPATALNVLTVGSIAKHDRSKADIQRPNEIDHLSAANINQPSPFTRHGPTVKGAIKPELVAFGGNSATQMRFEGKQWKVSNDSPGVMSLNPSFVGNTLLSICNGTSFAAPYITHLAGRVLANYPQASSNLLRAILVNQADMPEECFNTFSNQQAKEYSKSNNNRSPDIDIAGYGKVNEENLYRSDETSVLLMAEDSISNDSHIFYELPLPKEFLRGNRSYRELRISLSYMPAVKTTRLDYRATKIVFTLVKGSSLEQVQKHFNKNMQKDIDGLKESSSTNRRITSTLRNKGTVQCSTWSFKQLSPRYKWFVVVTRQDSFGWGNNISKLEENYALVVTVSDKENQQAELYNKISEIIEIRTRERTRGQSKI
jgi:hypothetical protein